MASIKRKAAIECSNSFSTEWMSKKVKLDDMESWIAKLDTTLDKNITEHGILGKIFGEKLEKSKILKHKVFWPKLIGSIIRGLCFKPETAICWINFHLINLINENKLELSSPEELLSYLQPFMTIKSLFQMFAERNQVPTTETVGYYRVSYTPAAAGRSASISLASRNGTSDVLIAKVTENSISEVTRNTCLLITFLIALCESSQKVYELITLENEQVLKYLSAAVLDIKKKATDTSQPPPNPPQSQIRLNNSVEQIQTANFALLAFMQCFDELPEDVLFAELLSTDLKEHLSNLVIKANAKEVAMGRVKPWPTHKKQYATLTFHVLAYRALAKVSNWNQPSPLIACTSGMNPLSWGRWVFGNYAIGHQTYQLKTRKQPGDMTRFYAELRPLTPGPIKFGFAPSVEEERESLQDLTAVSGSICYDFYENGLWINNKEYIPRKDNEQSDLEDSETKDPLVPSAKFDSLTYPQERKQLIVGVLLDTEAKNELEAVQFFLNGKEMNSQMDTSDIEEFSSKRLWEDLSSFFLSVAPTAFQQAILVLNRQNWKYNRHNEEVSSFEDIAIVENDVDSDIEEEVEEEEEVDEDAWFSADDNELDDDGEVEDLGIENNDDGGALGLRDIDWLSEYETSDRILTEKKY